jgi:hypothetical protein
VPERDRDRSVDALLRRVLSDDVAVSDQAECLEAEKLAAWSSGSLRADEAATVERHVADCSRCRTLVAVFLQSTPAEPARDSVWRRWRLGWLVPIATAATAAALWVAIPENTPVYQPQEGAATTVARDATAPDLAAPPASAPEPSPPAAPPSQEAARLREERAPAAGTAASKRTNETAARELADQRSPAAAPPALAERDRQEVANSAPQPFAARLSAVPPREIVAPGDAARWRILGQQLEWSTSNGNSWEPVAITTDGALTAGAAPSSSVCWVVGRGGAVYLTTDGVRFMRLPFPEMADLVSITATDDRRAVVSAADGRSWQTSDRGVTWSMGR